MQLRGYQEKLISDIRTQFLAGHKRVLAVSPTGSGKTATTAAMIKRTIAKGGSALFTVHRQELMDQSISAFNEQEIDHGCIAAGYDGMPNRNVQIASIDTLRRRLDKLSFVPSLVVVDEAAHSCSETWRFVIEHFGKSRVVGLTATPERLDGKGLGSIYQQMVEGPTTDWLIKNGFLSPYELFAPTNPDLSGVRTVAGDYDRNGSAGIMDNPTITGDAVREYKRHCDGKRAIAFCVSVEHSQRVAETFRESGIVALHLDGQTPKHIRRQAVGDFRAGNIKTLTSVDIFSEGFDLPAVECVIQLNPTQSLSKDLQQIGRALRTSEGKDRAIILDHAGNVRRHGLPDDQRTWSLNGRKKRQKSDVEVDIHIRQCPDCYCNHRTSVICPSCGFVYPIKSREIDHVDGDLVKFERGAVHAKQPKSVDREVYEARSRDALEKIALQRGYKNPSVWAEIRMAARENRKPNYAIAMSRRRMYA